MRAHRRELEQLASLAKSDRRRVNVLKTVVCSSLALIAGMVSAASPSPYVGEDSRDVKALGPQEISDYLSGQGLGLAKAAELNGYPGPTHVLELAVELDLTAAQKAQTEALFSRMHERAIALGEEFVREERMLDRLFATRTVTFANLSESLARIGRLQGELRRVHLDAHVEQSGLLTPQQIEEYRRLRGYGGAAGHDHGTHRP
jgi:Spy/CpxP family protein refolding chaperone